MTTPETAGPPALEPKPSAPEIEAAEVKAAGTDPDAVDFVLRLRPPQGIPNWDAVVRSRLQRCRGLTGPEIWELALSKKWIHPATPRPAWAWAAAGTPDPAHRAGITP